MHKVTYSVCNVMNDIDWLRSMWKQLRDQPFSYLVVLGIYVYIEYFFTSHNQQTFLKMKHNWKNCLVNKLSQASLYIFRDSEETLIETVTQGSLQGWSTDMHSAFWCFDSDEGQNFKPHFFTIWVCKVGFSKKNNNIWLRKNQTCKYHKHKTG